MHMASVLGIKTAKHALVRLSSKNLAYITQRFDRTKGMKLANENLCQLTETLTEHKYRSSCEKTGKTIQKYSTQSGLDGLSFFELVLFSFIIGNADLHLKNFSMLENTTKHFTLSPAHDLLSTYIAIAEEDEQMSLTINGRKNKIEARDFKALAKSLNLNDKQIQNSYIKFSKKKKEIMWWIANSFLPNAHKEKLQRLIDLRMKLVIQN